MTFISTKLSGRLGNNVFQIMTCMAHAWRNGVDYKIPSFVKSKYTKKNPFDNFPTLTPEDEAMIEVEHYDDGWVFNPIPYEGKNMRIAGYYQNLNYFNDYRKELIEAFDLPKEKIDAVCVHVRRGDYARYPTKWPMLPNEYYLKAAKSLSTSLKEKTLPVHLFSDEDVDMTGADRYFIAGDPLEDWLLMTQYTHFIIANSTYSFTAAYLSGSDNVIAPHPDRWYGPDNKMIFNGELIPENWIKI